MSFPFFFSSFVIFHLVTIDWSSICYTIITPRSDNEDNDHLWRLCNKVDLELFVKSYFIIRKFHFSLPSSVFLDIHLRFFFILLLLFASRFLLPLWLSGGSSAPSPAAVTPPLPLLLPILRIANWQSRSLMVLVTGRNCCLLSCNNRNTSSW